MENSERHRTGPAKQARDTEFSKRCANGGKTTASTCQFSSRTTCFSTVCIVRQFPWPAFDWRHLPIYRMNLISWFLDQPKSLTKAGPLPKSGPAASGPKTTPFFHHRPKAPLHKAFSYTSKNRPDSSDNRRVRTGFARDEPRSEAGRRTDVLRARRCPRRWSPSLAGSSQSHLEAGRRGM